WELYVGTLDGHHSSVFMYNRLVNAVPIKSSTPSSNPTQTATVSGGSTPSPSGGSTPTPTPTRDPKPSPTPSPTPDPKPSPTPSPTPTPESKRIPTPLPKPCVTPTVTPDPKVSTGQSMVLQTLLNPGAGPNQGVLDNDLSSVLSSSTPRVLASNVIALDFDQNFQVLHFQQYTLMDNNWEVYTGGFVNSNQDGLLLYDRVLREVSLLGFDSNLHITHNQPIHNVDGNWEVVSGDFNGTGRSQVLFYNPIGGNAQILTLKTDLSLADTKNYTGWGTNQVLYVGHFGAPT